MRYFFHLALVIFCYCSFPTVARGVDKSEVVVGIDASRLEELFVKTMDLLKLKMAATSGFAVYNIVPQKSPAQVEEISVCGENCMKVLRNERGLEVLEVINEDYAFVLTRPKAGEFSISGVQRKGISLSDDLVIREKMNTARYYLLDAYSFSGRTVWGLVQDPGFKLIKIDAFSSDAGEVLVRVDFNYAPVEKPPYEGMKSIEDWTLKNAYLIFAPNNGWKLVEYGRPVWPRTVVTVSNHPSDQLGFTETAIARFIGDDGKVKQENRVSCVKSSYDPIPKEQFYLSHYGFPEPNFGSGSRWPWILGGLTLGAVCLVVSRRLLRR